MYSLEKRMKAVQLYIDSDCSEAKVICSLGYPSPNTLRQWYKEYMQTGTLHHKVRHKCRYTQEQITAAVRYYDEHGGSLAGTARALGYPSRNTLSLWVRTAHSCRHQEPEKSCELDRKLIRCSPEQKQAAVKSWMSGTPDYKVAAQYGVSRAAVYVWKKQLLGKRPIRMKKEGKPSFDDELPDSKEGLEVEIRSLQTQIHQLKLERDVLEKAAELIKKGQGINLENLTNAEKAEVIDALKEEYRLCDLLNFLKMAKSSYFYQRNITLRPDKYEGLRAAIKTIFYENFQCYGYRRIRATLRRKGNIVSEKVVRRIMREEHLLAHL